MADAARTFGDQAFSERTVREAKGNRPARAARFQFAGRRGFQIHAQVMQPARPRQAGFQRGVQNGRTVAEQFLRVREREALEKILRRDARPRREQAVKMELAQARAPGQRRQIRLLDVARIQKADDLGDAFVIIHVLTLPRDNGRSHPILAPFNSLSLPNGERARVRGSFSR